MAFFFENMDVYKRAIDFTDKVAAVSRTFPRGQAIISDQLRRAANSIPLNVAEGSGRWNKGEKRQFYMISRGSAFECVAAAEICFRQSLIDKEKQEELRAELEAICQMLTKLIKSVS